MNPQDFSESLFPMGGSVRPKPTARTALGRALAPATAWLGGLAARERLMVLAGAAAVGVLVLWLVALRPAWRTVVEVPAQRQALAIQALQMQQLATETRELRAMPAIATAQATAAMAAATQRLGAKAKLTTQGDRTVVSFTDLPPEQWRNWLAEVRSGARVRPVDAQLSVGPQGLTGSVTLAAGGAP